jgi:hypothetical protein
MLTSYHIVPLASMALYGDTTLQTIASLSWWSFSGIHTAILEEHFRICAIEYVVPGPLCQLAVSPSAAHSALNPFHMAMSRWLTYNYLVAYELVSETQEFIFALSISAHVI